MTKVSVIVPVYNPGRDIDDCIRSLTDQSLPTDEYEVIFVDDGSTDETPARLDALAAEHENVHVRHIPNSGWPGKPRNIGIDMAKGEFVYFVDNDDWIEHEALERLHDRATSLGSDIVMGKVVGQGNQRVPRGIFRQNHDEVDLEWRPLLYLLSPHKLFRRAFLDEHGLRFPEGRRRLEDHVFVMAAYFRARKISVLSDYVCYHWVGRQNDASASRIRWNPEQYFENVREVLDIVEQNTEPGPLRDRLLTHWYRGKMLRRLGPPVFVVVEDAWRRKLYREIRKLTLERFDAEWSDKLVPFNYRIRAELLREDRYHDLLELAKMEERLKAYLEVRDVVDEDGRIALKIDGRLRWPEGPIAFVQDGERLLWNAPEWLGEALPETTLDATKTVRRSRADLLLRNVDTNAEFELPVEISTRVEDVDAEDGRLRAVVSIDTVVDPATAAAGAPLPAGTWQVRGEVFIAGFRAGTPAIRPGRGKGHRLLVVTDGEGGIEQRWVKVRTTPIRTFLRRAYRSAHYRTRKALGRIPDAS